MVEQVKILDDQKLAELQEILEEGFDEVLQAYLDDAQLRIREMRSAHGAAAARELSKVAHTLKGSSLNIGAERLGRMCSVLDLACREGELADNAATQIDAIEAELGEVASHLEGWMARG